MSEEQFASYTYNEPLNKDFLVSDRDVKGYNGEVLVKNCLDKLNISYTGNPLDNIQLWKQFQGHGVDFRIKSLNVELEVKNIDGKVFRSWILRDWIPRFSYKHEKRIVAIPITTKLPTISLETLFTYDINIVCFDSLKYIIPKEGNKVVVTSNMENEALSRSYNVENGSSRKEISVYNVKSRMEGDQNYEFEMTVKASNDETNIETVHNSSGDYQNDNANARPKDSNIQNTFQVCDFINWKPKCRLCFSKRYCNLYREFRNLIKRWNNLEKEKPKRQITLFEDPSKVKEELNEEFKPKYEKLVMESQDLFNKITSCIQKREEWELKSILNPYSDCCQFFRIPKRRRKDKCN